MKLDDPVSTLAWYSEAKAVLADLPSDARAHAADLNIDHPSVARLGGAIDTVRDHLRALEGVKFVDEHGHPNGALPQPGQMRAPSMASASPVPQGHYYDYVNR